MPPTSPAPRIALISALAVAALAVTAPAALATTVSRDGNTITIAAAAGEDNSITVADALGTVNVTESNNGAGATLTNGGGCAAPVGNTVACGATATVTLVSATLLDMDDDFDGALGIATALNNVDFGSGNDSGNGDIGNDTLVGGPGNDDSLSGNAGNDTLQGGIGGDGLDGGPGDDTLQGEDGNDGLFDPLGTNTLDGGDGSDSLTGGTGVDQLLGGLGDDNFSASSPSAGADVFDGGPGQDFASFSNEGEPLSITLDDQANDLKAGQGANVTRIESINGGTANDTIVGGAGDEQLGGGDGADAITGGGGNDRLIGGSQNDTLAGGDGNDALFGSSGDDALRGEAGGDLLYGDTGADDMLGGDGRDTVDFGGGVDYGGVVVTLDDQPNDGAQGEGDNAHSDNENIDGTGGPDYLVGGPGRNTISGGDGYDTIVTRDGNATTASADTALCGDDEDTVLADPKDAIGSGAQNCEIVDYGNTTGFGPQVGIKTSGKRAGRHGSIPVTLRCPLTARGGCEGTATLEVSGKKAGHIDFSLRAGQEIDRDLALSRKARKKIKRRGKAQGTLTAEAKDEIGASGTSTKNVTLKR